ncbi:MAG: EutN/CcmL family microcompartment protein [Candidatus Sumerlaeota bacterium]|nr:EutN/CcmL family microcompartment protein [Candidatus Sumerlaeota bacterium]
MIIGKIVGTVVSTQKDEGLRGFKLLVVRSLDAGTGKLGSSYIIACDAIGAGGDDVVLVVAGSSARMTAQTQNKPVDSAIVAIVDHVEVEGKLTYQKFAPARA